MSQINYSQMSDKELKTYSLAHRSEKEAFEAYMARLNQRPGRVRVGAGEIDALPISEQIEIIAQRLKPMLNKEK